MRLLSLCVLPVLLLLYSTHAVLQRFPSCTGRLRVCQDGEQPTIEEVVNGTVRSSRVCSENKLERNTVILTGAGWWSSVYIMWIVQIILEEALQVPVQIENVHGGNTQLWEFDTQVLDVLDNRLYSWDALHAASSGSMDCSSGFRANYYADVPADLGASGCVENCYPCAHAMLEVWPNGQEAEFERYVSALKTVEFGGSLGMIGEFGWWATKTALDANPLLSTFRGLTQAQDTKVFKYAMSFGEYCNHTYAQWYWIVITMNPFAMNSSVPAHFCHYFFTYTMATEYGLIYQGASDSNFLDTRLQQLGKCAAAQVSEVFEFYDLCFRFWLTRVDLYEKLPLAEAELIRNGYGNHRFLFPGFFTEISSTQGGHAFGMLHSESCAGGTLMETPVRTTAWNGWSTMRFGEDGFYRFPAYDVDLISAHNLALKPFNTRTEVSQILEVSGRLRTENAPDSSPILISFYRPSSIFERHKHVLNEVWGGYSGEEFELSSVQLPDYDESCDTQRRNYSERCVIDINGSKWGGAQCGYKREILYKALASKLSAYSPEAYYVLRRVSFTRSQIEQILGQIDYSASYSHLTPPARSRQVICDWVTNNTNVWENWLPRTWNQVRCLGELWPGQIQLDPGTETSDFIECSGHGVCVATPALLENHPNAGTCECDQGYVGDDCSGLVDPTALNVGFGDLLFLCVAFCKVALLVACIYIIRFMKKHGPASPVFHTAQLLFVRVVVYSLMASSIGVFLWVGPTHPVVCMLRPVFVVVPYVTIMGAVFIKLVLKKFKRAMNEEETRKGVLLFVSIQTGLFLLWFVAAPPTAKEHRLSDRVWLSYYSCEYGINLAAFEALFFVFGLVLSMGNCYLAWDLRHRPSYFKEGIYLRHMCFSLSFVASLIMLLSKVFVSPLEVEKFVAIAYGTLVCEASVAATMLYPKWYTHRFTPELNNLKDGLYRPFTGGADAGLGDPDTDLYNRVLRKLKIPGVDLTNVAASLSKRLTKVTPEDAQAIGKRAIGKRTTAWKQRTPLNIFSSAYRAPAVLTELEERFRQKSTENERLKSVLEQHRIDPVTGEIEKDYMEVIQDLKTEHHQNVEGRCHRCLSKKFECGFRIS